LPLEKGRRPELAGDSASNEHEIGGRLDVSPTAQRIRAPAARHQSLPTPVIRAGKMPVSLL